MTYLDYLVKTPQYLLWREDRRRLAREAVLYGGHRLGAWALAKHRRALLTLEVSLN